MPYDYNRQYVEQFKEKFGGEERWVICGNCEGEGRCLTESLCGDVTEMLAEDPDFAEGYWGGSYDVRCECCGGSGKVKTSIPTTLTPEQEKFTQEFWEWASATEECERAERGYCD